MRRDAHGESLTLGSTKQIRNRDQSGIALSFVPRLLTAVNVLLIRLRQGRNHWVVAARLNVRAAARPSWAALTIPRARVTNTTTWHRS
jgi:hypothetical protein